MKENNLKPIVFKYTFKRSPKQEYAETHYVRAYGEKIARSELAKKLNVDESLLRLSKKNLPHKIRKAILNKKDNNYVLTLDLNQIPDNAKTIEEIQSEMFDLKASMLRSVKYKVNALFTEDPELIQEYSRGDNDTQVRERAYKSIRKMIVDNDYVNEEHIQDVTLLDVIDSYQTNFFNAKEQIC